MERSGSGQNGNEKSSPVPLQVRSPGGYTIDIARRTAIDAGGRHTVSSRDTAVL